MKKQFLFVALFLLAVCLFGSVSFAVEPVRIVFDTDLGTDVDDAMAISVIHALQNRGQCELLAITTTTEHPFVPKMAALLNTFYGRPDIPVAVVRNTKAKDPGRYVQPVVELKDDAGNPRYKFEQKPYEELPEAVSFLRKLLASEKDGSVVMIQVGFFTNFARLLDTPGDDVSPLTGKELIAKKVKFLSIMAGHFRDKKYAEFNVKVDIPAAKKLVAQWPGEIVFSGFEIGAAIQHPAASMRQDYDYVKYHPLKDAYQFHHKGLERSQATFDLTSVLYAVRPDRGYFTLSPKGTVSVHDDGTNEFEPSETGKHRYMTVTPEQIGMAREALVELCSEPPKK